VKIRTTVLCLPVANLDRTLLFYQEVFGLPDAQIEEEMIALELPNLSLFLMSRKSYESYTFKAKRNALLPGTSAPAIISCAVETKQDVDQALAKAEGFESATSTTAEIDALSGGYIGYVSDPDGHLWELVCPKHLWSQADASQETPAN